MASDDLPASMQGTQPEKLESRVNNLTAKALIGRLYVIDLGIGTSKLSISGPRRAYFRPTRR